MIEIVNIAPEHEVLLGFLYPTYTITDSTALTTRFITHRDVTSVREKEELNAFYDKGVFISTKLFDKFLDQEELKKMALQFAHNNFKDRRRTVNAETDTFVADIINFIYSTVDEEVESSIYELFDAFGSAKFNQVFLQKSQTIPIPVLERSMLTFISKILNPLQNVYYKKKNLVYSERIKSNMNKALTNMTNSLRDNYGLYLLKFYNDLLQ